MPVLADWTNDQNEVIGKFVRAYEREGIPLYLVIPADESKPVIVLPQVITGNTILEALEAAKS